MVVMSEQFGKIQLYFIFLKIQQNSSHKGVVHTDAEVLNVCRRVPIHMTNALKSKLQEKCEPMCGNAI